MADIPGIIEGASEGRGLGLRFLRHIERNAVLLFVIPADADDIHKEYEILLGELERFNPQLVDKPRIIAISKCDMLDDELIDELRAHLGFDIPTVFISAVTGYGLTELKDTLWRAITDESNRLATPDIVHRPSTATTASARKTSSYSSRRPWRKTPTMRKPKTFAPYLPMPGARISISTSTTTIPTNNEYNPITSCEKYHPLSCYYLLLWQQHKTRIRYSTISPQFRSLK